MKIVQSTIRPEEVEVDEYSVWISENIREISVGDEEGVEHIEYEYELTQLTKDEYILALAQAQRESSLAMQLAQAEILDTILKGGV